jgi:hypothetical protein
MLNKPLDLVEIHKTAIVIANQTLIDRYGTDDFDYGTKKHDEWLAEYDRCQTSLILHGEVLVT